MTAKQRQPSKKRRADADPSLIESLACGRSRVDAARLAAVTVRTVDRRLKDPSFVSAVDKFRAGMLESASGKLALATNKAVTVLQELLDSPKASIRLGSARVIVDSVIKITELTQIENRVRLLEDAIRINGGRLGDSRNN